MVLHGYQGNKMHLGNSHVFALPLSQTLLRSFFNLLTITQSEKSGQY